MSGIASIGPTTPPNEPRGLTSLGHAIESYAHLLSHPNPTSPHELETIARKTVELSQLAQSVMQAASPALRAAAEDLEKLLQSPISISGMPENISILTASEHYLRDPGAAELGPLIQELCHNSFALALMCNELAILSSSIKSPSAFGT